MQLINGLEIAKNIKLSIAHKVIKFEKKPCLVVIIVGANKASKIYVKNKEKACEECGFKSIKYELDENIKESELIELLDKLNRDDNISAILVQVPLPKHIDENKIFEAVCPEKDVDCFHPVNVGKLFSSKSNDDRNIILPCTASGCLRLIKSVDNYQNLEGKNVVVIGRSNIVGKPLAQLLLNENCTVTIAHSRTKNLKEIASKADIIVIAIGKPKFLKKDMIKENVLIIDVGINRLDDGTVCGDVDFEDVKDKCLFITPVPKGVGPMTIACLMENTYNLFLRNNRYK